MLKRFLGVICCCIVLVNTANAQLIEWDAFDEGDGLAVKDEDTGLVWLDLSVTAGEHYYDIGNMFAGWEHASYNHVEALIGNVFPDIVASGIYGIPFSFEQGCSYSTLEGSCYQTAKDWQNLFGSTVGSKFYQTYAYGLYEDEYGILRMAGSYLNGTGSANRYGVNFSVDYSASYDVKYVRNEFANFSSFLLLTSSLSEDKNIALVVDEPNIAYMFMFMFGSMLMVNRKRRV